MQDDVECESIKEVELIVQPENEEVTERTDLAEWNAMLNSCPGKRPKYQKITNTTRHRIVSAYSSGSTISKICQYENLPQSTVSDFFELEELISPNKIIFLDKVGFNVVWG